MTAMNVNNKLEMLRASLIMSDVNLNVKYYLQFRTLTGFCDDMMIVLTNAAILHNQLSR